ncbi:hypothetical protein COX68_03370 [Candidatus Falkowbacteria bacterium CG_4_10_14_0_2_um_filter_41_15]|uniref:Lcl C-terminal domain-containing protein n=2 Tax=Candidatus Falkowiibacteriota TaxID=1752728 RepID=A0A2M7RYB5_9BACT|nr:MAG: hypothetical protein COY54_00990 [Candidatus Falkowbacteria bacterium CG_4_10_14_0_8_um_filter_41_36]PJA09102.1 MAG: hypothetical protein COX68_03370 [Candidatus Falkowbacteria bacterium CG_4_10_14_0_2_um_filter_41_15]
MSIIPKKLSGSALLMTLLVLTGIFIIAFGAGYLSFFNTKNTDIYQQSARARLAAEAGAERMKWELGNNDYDLDATCGLSTSTRLFETQFDDGSYYLKCDFDQADYPKIQAVGVYKNISVTLDTGICYNIETECTSTCALGSLCGGGALFSASPLMVASPSGCTDISGTGCDNSFTATSTPDTASLAWDNATTSVTSATDADDGRVNVTTIKAANGGNVPANLVAIKFCEDLSVNSKTGWYLPAKNELNTVLRNSNYCTEDSQGPEPLYCDHSTSTSPIIGGFSNSSPYMSSTENDVDTFWSQDFTNGTQATSTKSSAIFLRCIRRP